MGVRRFLLTAALTAALVPSVAVRADLNYRAEISGAEDSDLAALLDKVSELKRSRTNRRPPKKRCAGAPTAIWAGLRTPHTASAIGTRNSLMT